MQLAHARAERDYLVSSAYVSSENPCDIDPGITLSHSFAAQHLQRAILESFHLKPKPLGTAQARSRRFRSFDTFAPDRTRDLLIFRPVTDAGARHNSIFCAACLLQPETRGPKAAKLCVSANPNFRPSKRNFEPLFHHRKYTCHCRAF